MIQTEEKIDKKTIKLAVDCPFGRIEYEDKDILMIPEGLYGYDEYKRYIVLKMEEYLPFQWLVCVDDPELIFPVVDPRIVNPDYHPRITGMRSQDGLLVIVTMGQSKESITANLRAPIHVFHGQNRARQVILSDSHYPLRYHVMKS
jgi:flagellar assembly factor FliW